MKILFASLPLFFALNASAQMFDMDRTDVCTAGGEKVTLKQLQERLVSQPAINGCDVYDSTYFESMAAAGLSSGDKYNGPVLLIKMIANGTSSYTIRSAVILIRDNKNLCIEPIQDNGALAKLYYRTDYSEGEGWVDFLLNTTTFSQQLTMEFTHGVLSSVYEDKIVAGTAIFNGGQKDRQTFACGSAAKQNNLQ